MMKRALFSLLVLSLLVELTPATSTSGTRLTPANLKTQPLDFVIHAEKIGTLTRFMVSVQRLPDKKAPAMAGYLVVVDGKTKLASCPVAGAKQPKNVMYEFLVNNNHLQQSRFLLEETEAKKMGLPPGSAYWFILEDFALVKASSTAGAALKQ